MRYLAPFLIVLAVDGCAEHHDLTACKGPYLALAPAPSSTAEARTPPSRAQSPALIAIPAPPDTPSGAQSPPSRAQSPAQKQAVNQGVLK